MENAYKLIPHNTEPPMNTSISQLPFFCRIFLTVTVCWHLFWSQNSVDQNWINIWKRNGKSPMYTYFCWSGKPNPRFAYKYHPLILNLYTSVSIVMLEKIEHKKVSADNFVNIFFTKWLSFSGMIVLTVKKLTNEKPQKRNISFSQFTSEFQSQYFHGIPNVPHANSGGNYYHQVFVDHLRMYNETVPAQKINAECASFTPLLFKAWPFRVT